MLRELLLARSTAVLDCARNHLLLRTDVTGLDQLAEWHAGGERPLTAFDERVITARYRPGHRQAVVEGDAGGDEHSQLWLLDLDGPVARDRSMVQALTDDSSTVHHLAGMSPDGHRVAILSNRRDRVAFDVRLLGLDGGEERLLYDGGGWCQPASGFSPDGRWLSVLRPGPRPMDNDLLLLDVATGEQRVVLPHPGHAAVVGAPAWVDATTLLVSSNRSMDRHALIRVDITTDEVTVVLARAWDVAGWTSPDGRTLLAVSNVDGSSAGELFDAQTMAPRGRLRLPDPDTVLAWSHLLPDPLVADDGGVVATCGSPSMPPDVWRLRSDAPPEPVTRRPPEVDRTRLRRPERHTVTSADGLVVPLLLYRPVIPAGAPPPPAVVLRHGGPEGQSQPVFSPVVQAFAARGYAVALPNVRGSTGYGKRYYSLDDTTRRLDSLLDLAAVHGWLTHAGLDPARVALWGTSYGGYLVLAGCAFQPELWAAGVDVVGISDLITFLERTADHRRAHREREYGSLSTDWEFLAAAPPLRRADAIRAPIFLVHGANDPRVPLNEAQQLVAALKSRDVPCELLVYGDEGHGWGTAWPSWPTDSTPIPAPWPFWTASWGGPESWVQTTPWTPRRPRQCLPVTPQKAGCWSGATTLVAGSSSSRTRSAPTAGSSRRRRETCCAARSPPARSRSSTGCGVSWAPSRCAPPMRWLWPRRRAGSTNYAGSCSRPNHPSTAAASRPRTCSVWAGAWAWTTRTT